MNEAESLMKDTMKLPSEGKSERGLPSNLVKSRSREIGNLNYRIDLKFNRPLGSAVAGMPVKFQNDRTILNTNLAASRLCEILQYDVLSDIKNRTQEAIAGLNMLVTDPVYILVQSLQFIIWRLGVRKFHLVTIAGAESWYPTHSLSSCQLTTTHLMIRYP